MPVHHEERVLPYTPQQLYDLVCDVDSYPTFLPWCLKAKVHEQTATHILADLTVGKGFLRDTFTSHVHLAPPKSIQVDYKNGPLKHLHNAWTFTDISEQNKPQTKVTFSIDFEFHASALNGLMNAFFSQAFSTMMQAFEKEARKRYKR